MRKKRWTAAGAGVLRGGKAVRGQAFRRNIQQFVLPSSGEVQRVAEFLRTHRTVDARGRNACFHKRTDLILHQRNER